MRAWFIGVAIVLFGPGLTYAQDPVKVDPKHYTVIQEDDTFRVLRVRFGPKEKSPLHDHPAGCFYFVTDLQSKQTGPDGKVTDGIAKAGDAGCGPAFRHAPENVGGKPYEVIVYELKSGRSAAQVPADLRQAIDERQKAVNSADASSWDRLTSGEFTLVDATGRMSTKAERLAALKTQRPQATTSPSQEQVSVYGNTAVQRAQIGMLWVIQVWHRQPQGWQVVSTQTTTVTTK